MKSRVSEWQFTLPDGWMSERQPFERAALYTIVLPDRLGFLTVDFTTRRFTPGLTGPVSLACSKTKHKPSHRGWHQKLVNEAVAWARRELGAP